MRQLWHCAWTWEHFFWAVLDDLRGVTTQSSADQGVKVSNAKVQLHILVVMAIDMFCINAGH